MVSRPSDFRNGFNRFHGKSFGGEIATWLSRNQNMLLINENKTWHWTWTTTWWLHKSHGMFSIYVRNVFLNENILISVVPLIDFWSNSWNESKAVGKNLCYQRWCVGRWVGHERKWPKTSHWQNNRHIPLRGKCAFRSRTCRCCQYEHIGNGSCFKIGHRNAANKSVCSRIDRILSVQRRRAWGTCLCSATRPVGHRNNDKKFG